MTATEQGASTSKDVSCIALTFFYDYLEAHDIPRSRLQEGLAFSPEYLDGKTNWIDWQTFLAIERRMEELLPEPDLFYRIGLSFGATKGFGFLRPIFRAVVSPWQAYSLLPRLVPRFLFTFVDIRFDRVSSAEIRATYSFRNGFLPSEAWLETVRGILTGIPIMLGDAPPQITVTRHSPGRSVFDIHLSRAANGVLDVLTTVGRRALATGRMLWSNAGDAMSELEVANRLLHEKVDDLTLAKSQLDRRVHQLSALNAVARSASGELDLSRLIDRITATVGRALGDLPTAVLLGEGQPSRLVVASSAGFDERSLQAIRLAPLEELLSQGRPIIVPTPPEQVCVVPMIRRDKLMAALAVPFRAGEHDESFLESLAWHLATAIDNAQAYRTITDLRDNLEVRVRERTAELQEARGQLEETVDRLRRSDRARNEFFTNVSHELRTPLTLILAPLDALEASVRESSPEARELLQHIRENAQSLLRLINEILDFARLDAERMPLVPSDVDLCELVGDAVTVLRPLADRKQVSLTFEAPPAPLHAYVDPKLTRRVVLNLIGNAVKYVDEHQAVRVSLAGTPEEIRLEVSDNGPGIAPEDHARIFERFQRVTDTAGRTVQGSGIGLAMVKEIVQLHRGSIEVESEQGKGATFRVHLPRTGLARAVPAGAEVSTVPDDFSQFVESLAPAVRSVPERRPEPATAPEGRLLIVEDNDEMRSFLARLFAPRYQLLLARDGEEGLQAARNKLPEAIVSDVMMPRLDGYELCRQLKAAPETRNIPIILVSARHGPEAALEGFTAGADDFVVKPFSAPELLARVSAQLRIRTLSLALMRMEKQTTLGLMAAGIAHEVLNPVNAIVNAVPSLRRTLHEDPRKAGPIREALLDSVDRSGHRIQNVVQAILTFSRQDQGELRLRELRLSEGIEATLSILAFRLHDGIAVHRDYAWNGTLDCYPELLNQLIMNLLVNAVDALGPQGGNIWISLDRDDDAVRLSVRDDGPGVQPALRERVFDPFFTTKPVGTGTGLGLPLAREIATLHGGTIELRPGPEGGAEFLLTLPTDLAGRHGTATRAGDSAMGAAQV